MEEKKKDFFDKVIPFIIGLLVFAVLFLMWQLIRAI